MLKIVADIISLSSPQAVVKEEDDGQYGVWQVKGDSSLVESLAAGYWKLELVSPIMYTMEWMWHSDLSFIFGALRGAFNFHLNQACSMHIHTKPLGEWHPETVRSLAKATAVFDDAIAKIMPGGAQADDLARPNFRKTTNSDPAKAKLIPKLSGTEERLVCPSSTS
ncbi:hypothetical protein N657DRAFT_679202 [Parathielavia appendiculata]|uniref:Uncharacterized protein n=1 Tax=Parathielavia appendiculata TaxID=2587402 RepID=A0AAN6Z5R9_9PEZI|nr:hypothetical protein N657DRAFT_679202 [Parathielavia appendiculata]